MFARSLVAAAVLGLSFSALADAPNIEPGMWEYKSTITFESDFPIPDQSDTTNECVTAEDVASGDAFVDDMEGCEMTRRDMRSDGMDYAMSCSAPDGTEVNMQAVMHFHGDRANGTITGDMATPMGPMKMNITMEGRRTGDCPG